MPSGGWNKGKHWPIETREKMSIAAKETNARYWAGRKRPKATREKISKALLGHPPNNPRRGKDHPAWKGGISWASNRYHKSPEYKRWRRVVCKRDNYTCVVCGKTPKIVNAHHIVPFNDDEELRYAISNGITLCVPCHADVHALKYRRVKCL